MFEGATPMRTVKQIDAEIAELKTELHEVEGTPTEVYTRIVGYYRSLKNWNKGKREEYNHRSHFSLPNVEKGNTPMPTEETTSEKTPQTNRQELGIAEEHTSPSSYLYFYRKTCPNCPPVQDFLENSSISGEKINVDSEEGLEKASQWEVYSAPTVIFFDEENREILRAHDVSTIESQFHSAQLVRV
jgi:ribonucleoside-triphosphate reductase